MTNLGDWGLEGLHIRIDVKGSHSFNTTEYKFLQITESKSEKFCICDDLILDFLPLEFVTETEGNSPKIFTNDQNERVNNNNKKSAVDKFESAFISACTTSDMK